MAHTHAHTHTHARTIGILRYRVDFAEMEWDGDGFEEDDDLEGYF